MNNYSQDITKKNILNVNCLHIHINKGESLKKNEMEFTSSNAEQPLRGMELQEKEEKDERHKGKLIRNYPKKVPINTILKVI